MPEKQLLELRVTGVVQAHELAVQERALGPKTPPNILSQFAEGAKGMPVTGQQPAPAKVELGERTEAVALQLEHPIRIHSKGSARH